MAMFHETKTLIFQPLVFFMHQQSAVPLPFQAEVLILLIRTSAAASPERQVSFCILPSSQFLLRNEMGKVLPHPSNGTIGQCGNKSHLGKVKSLSFNWLPVDCLVKGHFAFEANPRSAQLTHLSPNRLCNIQFSPNM